MVKTCSVIFEALKETMTAFLKFVIVLLLLVYQVNIGKGFVAFMKPMNSKGDQTNQAAEKSPPTIVRSENSRPTTGPTQVTEPPNPGNNQSNTEPVVFVPVLQDVVFDAINFDPILPPPYPILFANQENLPLVPILDNLPFFPVDEYMPYFPLYDVPQPGVLPYNYYVLQGPNVVKPVTGNPVEQPSISLEKPVAPSKLEQMNNNGEIVDAVMQRILAIVNQFAHTNKTNLEDLRAEIQPENTRSSTAKPISENSQASETNFRDPTVEIQQENIHVSTIKPVNEFLHTTTNFDDLREEIQPEDIRTSTAKPVNTPAESETTTFPIETVSYSTLSTTETNDSLRMEIPIKLNQTDDGSAEETQNLTVAKPSPPERRIIKYFFNGDGNPCRQELASVNSATFQIITCKEKPVSKTTTPKSNVVYYTNELTTTTESQTQHSTAESNSSSENSTAESTPAVELNDFVFFAYE